ncbi:MULTISPECIES: ABC-three component system middle component 6 [unclassified Streptomyces]|uniref:ABC-three component system middle component 6 n=1 Tax=unclassified Streptomyces TaxID=2593676 RepID=UPI0034271B75
MLLPSKSIPSDQAMIAVGAQILIQLDEPGTVSAVWQRLAEWRQNKSMPSAVPFWWFALSLDLLYATGAVDIRDGELRRGRHVS